MIKRLMHYEIIFVSGFMITAAFMALNGEHKNWFWPIVIVFGAIFVITVQKVVKQSKPIE